MFRQPRSRVTLAICVALVACDVGDVGEGGMGLPRQINGETYPGRRQEIRGAVQMLDNGCIGLSAEGTWYFVIWPRQAALDDLVRLPGGEILQDGDAVVGTGALTSTAPLVSGNGYWENAIGFCAPEASEVIALDDVRLAP